MAWWRNILNLRRTAPRERSVYYGRSAWNYTQAGTHMNPDEALTLSAVWRAVGYISQSIAGLPWMVHKENVSGDKVTSVTLFNHPANRVLRVRANPEMSTFAFREQLLIDVLLTGNSYAEIERDNAGRVVNLWYIEANRVTVLRDENGEIYYDVAGSSSANSIQLAPADMIHIRGFGDGVVGYSPVAYAARTLGFGTALENYGSSFFGNGAHGGTALSHPGKLNKSARARLRESWDELLKGPKNAFKTIVLDEGLTATPLSTPNNDAEFLASRRFSVEDIARIFNVPLPLLHSLEDATYSNIENISRNVVTNTLLPWVTRLELEIDYKVLGNNYNGNFSKMDMSELLRGDPKSRGELYTAMFRTAAISPNEIRARENMNPVPGGDEVFVPVNNVAPLNMVEELLLKDKTPASAPPTEPPSSETDEDGEEVSAMMTTMMGIESDEQLAGFIANMADQIPSEEGANV